VTIAGCQSFLRGAIERAGGKIHINALLDVQRLIHNWVKPHRGLGKYVTPSMETEQEIEGRMGFKGI
jgi:hypothetical protein